MIWARLQTFLTWFDARDRDVRTGISKPLDRVDVGEHFMVAMTAMCVTLGVSTGVGLRPQQQSIAAALACISYFGVLFSRRAPTAVDSKRTSPEDLRDVRDGRAQITLHTPHTIYAPRHIPSWFALACAAGAVNGFAFLSCEEFVSHITGTSTRIGLEWIHLGLAVEYAVVLGCFVLGAIASVTWLQARACRGKRPRWATPLRAVALILACTAIAGHNGSFGPLRQTGGEPPFILLSVLAFAMGLQNAAVASTTGLAVRTTHLTGPATDLGIHLGTALFATGEERRDAFRGAALRIGKIISFIFGAALAVPLASQFGYLCLLAPALLVSFAAVLSFLPNWSPSDFPFRRPLPDNC